MINRLIKISTPNDKNDTTANSEKSPFDNLEKYGQVLDKEKMSHIEGGHTSNPQFNNDRLDITSMPGGGTPS